MEPRLEKIVAGGGPPIMQWFHGAEEIGFKLENSATKEELDYWYREWDAWNEHYQRLICSTE